MILIMVDVVMGIQVANMELHYSIKDLEQMEIQVTRSLKILEENGTVISGEHYLSVIKKLIEENRSLRDEIIEILQ